MICDCGYGNGPCSRHVADMDSVNGSSLAIQDDIAERFNQGAWMQAAFCVSQTLHGTLVKSRMC